MRTRRGRLIELGSRLSRPSRTASSARSSVVSWISGASTRASALLSVRSQKDQVLIEPGERLVSHRHSEASAKLHTDALDAHDHL